MISDVKTGEKASLATRPVQTDMGDSGVHRYGKDFRGVALLYGPRKTPTFQK
jgi:hypothetical protein